MLSFSWRKCACISELRFIPIFNKTYHQNLFFFSPYKQWTLPQGGKSITAGSICPAKWIIHWTMPKFHLKILFACWFSLLYACNSMSHRYIHKGHFYNQYQNATHLAHTKQHAYQYKSNNLNNNK